VFNQPVEYNEARAEILCGIFGRLLGTLKKSTDRTQDPIDPICTWHTTVLNRNWRGHDMKVILFGASGMVGQGVLRECLLDQDVESVLAVGRRPPSRWVAR